MILVNPNKNHSQVLTPSLIHHHRVAIEEITVTCTILSFQRIALMTELMMSFVVEMKILIQKHIDANVLTNIFILHPVRLNIMLKVRLIYKSIKNENKIKQFFILGPYRMNSIYSQDSTQYSCIHMPPICHCFSHYPKENAISNGYELKKNSVQFNETPNEFKFNEVTEKSKPIFTAQNHVSIIKSDVKKEGECTLEVLDEKGKHKSNEIETKVFKVMKKGLGRKTIFLNIS